MRINDAPHRLTSYAIPGIHDAAASDPPSIPGPALN